LRSPAKGLCRAERPCEPRRDLQDAQLLSRVAFNERARALLFPREAILRAPKGEEGPIGTKITAFTSLPMRCACIRR